MSPGYVYPFHKTLASSRFTSHSEANIEESLLTLDGRS